MIFDAKWRNRDRRILEENYLLEVKTGAVFLCVFSIALRCFANVYVRKILVFSFIPSRV